MTSTPPDTSADDAGYATADTDGPHATLPTLAGQRDIYLSMQVSPDPTLYITGLYVEVDAGIDLDVEARDVQGRIRRHLHRQVDVALSGERRQRGVRTVGVGGRVSRVVGGCVRRGRGH